MTFAGQISAVIVTRGDVDLAPCLSSIDADEVIIRRGNGGVWPRWAAARRAKHDVIYVQDDDCAVDFEAVVAAYDPAAVTCNMPAAHRAKYPDGIALVGFGAVFHRSKLDVFEGWEVDDLFRREADRVFTGMNPLNLIDAGVTHLPHAAAANRMWLEARHAEDLAEIRRKIYARRQAA